MGDYYGHSHSTPSAMPGAVATGGDAPPPIVHHARLPSAAGSGAVPVSDPGGKIFVGGLSWQTTEEALRFHFEQYGPVESVEVMRDRNTGKPRGFGFVCFTSSDTVDLVMARKNEHEINHKLVDVKRAQARGIAPPSIHTGDEGADPAAGDGGGGTQVAHGDRSSLLTPLALAGSQAVASGSGGLLHAGGKTAEELGNKVFVGGIPPNVDRDELKQIFSRFGNVADAIVMLDQVTQRSRCFGFVTFENDGTNAAQKAINVQPLSVQGRNVEIKLAMPRAEQPKAQQMAQHQLQLLTSLPPGSRHVGLRAGQMSAAASNSEYAGLAVAYGRNGWKAGYGSYAFGKNGWAVQGWEDYNDVKEPMGFSFAMLDDAATEESMMDDPSNGLHASHDEPAAKRVRH